MTQTLKMNELFSRAGLDSQVLSSIKGFVKRITRVSFSAWRKGGKEDRGSGYARVLPGDHSHFIRVGSCADMLRQNFLNVFQFSVMTCRKPR